MAVLMLTRSLPRDALLLHLAGFTILQSESSEAASQEANKPSKTEEAPQKPGKLK